MFFALPDSLSLAECCPAENTVFFIRWINELTNLIVYDLFDLYPMEPRAAFLNFFIRTILKIFILLGTMIYLVGLFRAALDVERAREYLQGRRKIAAYLAAALLGAVTPFCSCSAIPIFIAFTASGIPLGVTISFLITSPLINEVAVVLLASELGMKFMLVYTTAGITAGVAGGVFFDMIRAQRFVIVSEVDAEGEAKDLLREKRKHGLVFADRNQFAINEVKKIIGRVWIWIIIGVGVAALFHVFLPASVVEEKIGAGQWWSVPLAVLFGIPLYSSPTAIVPLAKTLILKGVPVGTAIAFMMSCTAASLPEFILLRQILKIKLLVILFIFFLVLFTLFGWFFNIVPI